MPNFCILFVFMMKSIVYRKPIGLDEVRSIRDFGRRLFRETFFVPCNYTEADLLCYFESDYSDDKVRLWIEDPNNLIMLAVDGDTIVGFMVIEGPTKLPHVDINSNSKMQGEIKKLYVDKAYWGKGIAKTLMETGLKWFNEDSCPYEGDAWISVWSGNIRAQNFYTKYGAKKVGEYLYPVGDVNDKEEIWRISAEQISALG